MIYYGHNHFRNPNGDSITLIDSSGNYLAYRTSHGVIIKKGNKYARIFVTDNDLTGAPQKLRWESVKTVKIIDDYVIVQQNLPIAMITNIFVIDIERGICGQLKTASYGSEPFIVHDNKLFVISDGKKELFLLEEIFKELMTQHKAKPNKN